jgi:hypothetical protein
MHRRLLVTLTATLASACGPFGPTTMTDAGTPDAGRGTCGTSGGFCDKLALGTSFTGFTLVGEASSFSLATTGGGTLSFRLESSAEFGNRAARLYINYPPSGGGRPTPYWQKDYTGLQSNGHILLSSFRVTDRGTYQVDAYLVEQVGPDIGKETFVASAPLTMTQ